MESEKKPDEASATAKEAAGAVTATTNTASSTENASINTAMSSSWWNSLMKTAKEKSATAFEIMRTDLAEFKSTMSADTNRLVTSLTTDADTTAASTTGTLFSSLSTLGNALGINTLISGMASTATDDDTDVLFVNKPGSVVVAPPGSFPLFLN